ncbi:MAG: DnaA regulatory inactivator Hda [Alphaproteobacteria bacterium MarineAlpha2_Bin1]|nr:MAG: DnaA regulatory inactivator Hda [Alphaproteobacteria bacterium MarineAlpha2_Bin1]|tara:strand:- start:1734 stop:2393 length:660 start_codon:yes stop_codon:yes gene_type:complete
MSQLNLEFRHLPAFDRKDFIVSTSNYEAVSWLDKWPNWPKNGLSFYGEPGSGKTHLIHCWKLMTNGLIIESSNLNNLSLKKIYKNSHVAIDNASKLPEEILFHVINICNEENGTIFLLDRKAPAKWNIKLQDLKSRVRSMAVIELKKPDDQLLELLFKKLFTDRQIKVNDEVVKFLLKRVERNFKDVQNLVDEIDIQSFANKKEITVPFVSTILKNMNI